MPTVLKDEFLATVSHELRTPLNAIVGWSSLLKSKRLGGDDIDQAIEIIERNAKSQAQIIEDILDVSRIITGKLQLKFELIALDILVKTSVEGLKPTAENKDITIRTNLEKSLYIKGDVERLRQVLWNLLSNAIKFTPNGGEIDVELISVDRSAQVSFKDNGQGINPNFVPFVFERFRQADSTTTRDHGGLGLGLSIVRHLVEMHGGNVLAKSEGKGKGATFIVEIPTVSAQKIEMQKREAEETLTTNNNLLKGIKILVVDDDEDSLELLKMIVETHGAETQSATSAAKALQIFEEFKPDILLSDIAMPHDDGYSLIRNIRSMPHEKSAIPAIALTAYVRESDKKRALETGFQMHIAKPINEKELIEAINSFAQPKNSPE